MRIVPLGAGLLDRDGGGRRGGGDGAGNVAPRSAVDLELAAPGEVGGDVELAGVAVDVPEVGGAVAGAAGVVVGVGAAGVAGVFGLAVAVVPSRNECLP